MNAPPLLIRNARIAAPGPREHTSVFCAEGRIAALDPGSAEIPDNTRTIAAEGLILLPGFIDIHSHGAGGHDTCDGNADSIRRIAEIKLAEGVTTWLPTTATLPKEQLLHIAAAVAEYRRSPSGARVPGLHVEGPFLNPAFIGAQNPAYVAKPSVELVETLHALCPVKILSLAVESEGAIDLIRHCAAKGIATSAAHSGATYACFREARAAGLRQLTHFCNQMSPLHHREVGLVGAGLLEKDFPIELICDGLHLCDDMLRLVFAAKPADSISLITDSMRAAWLGDGDYTFGERAVVVENGAARIKATGALAGTTLKFNQALARAARLSAAPPHELALLAAGNQARLCDLGDTGAIKPGFAADLVLLQPDYSIAKTILGGAVVFEE